MKDITKTRTTKKSDLISLVKLLSEKFFHVVTPGIGIVAVNFYAEPLGERFVSEWHFETNFYNKHLKSFFTNK